MSKIGRIGPLAYMNDESLVGKIVWKGYFGVNTSCRREPTGGRCVVSLNTLLCADWLGSIPHIRYARTVCNAGHLKFNGQLMHSVISK